MKVRPTDEIFRRFKITEDTKERDKFFTLIQEKNLSREDLILILRSVSLKDT